MPSQGLAFRAPAKRPLAIFIESMHDGGAERVVVNLAHGIVAQGYPIDIVLAKAEGPYLPYVPKSVRLIDLNASRVLTCLPGLVSYLRRERPTAMLAVMNHANVVALWARRLAHVQTRIVVSVHNTLSVSARHAPTLRARWMPRLVRAFYPWADGIVAVSNGVADDLVEVTGFSRDRVSVIYNPTLTEPLREQARAVLNHPWFDAGQPPVLLGVGRLREQKDFTTLIRAFAQLRRKRVARLLILGEGPERDALEALIRQLGLTDDVSLPGFVANPYAYMARSAGFVLSSKWEGLPGVLIEALYCGAPLISTDCPSGAREILANGRYGELTPVGDAPRLALAMERVLCGQAIRPPRESWQPFCLDTVVSQYLKLLNQQ